MGPKNACSYADLAMGEIDVKAKFLSRPYGDDIVTTFLIFGSKAFLLYINSMITFILSTLLLSLS